MFIILTALTSVTCYIVFQAMYIFNFVICTLQCQCHCKLHYHLGDGKHRSFSNLNLSNLTLSWAYINSAHNTGNRRMVTLCDTLSCCTVYPEPFFFKVL